MSGTTTPAGFAAELARIAGSVDTVVEPVIKKGALQVKTTARSRVAGAHSNAGKAAAGNYINFDMRGRLAAEIGYDKPGGALGTLNEYGSAGNSPDNALGTALETEAPVVGRYVWEAVGRLWR